MAEVHRLLQQVGGRLGEHKQKGQCDPVLLLGCEPSKPLNVGGVEEWAPVSPRIFTRLNELDHRPNDEWSAQVADSLEAREGHDLQVVVPECVENRPEQRIFVGLTLRLVLLVIPGFTQLSHVRLYAVFFEQVAEYGHLEFALLFSVIDNRRHPGKEALATAPAIGACYLTLIQLWLGVLFVQSLIADFRVGHFLDDVNRCLVCVLGVYSRKHVFLREGAAARGPLAAEAHRVH